MKILVSILLIFVSASLRAQPAEMLTLSAQKGDVEMVRKLLDAGMRVDAKDASTRTALVYAAQAGQVEVVRLLLSRRADPNARSDYPREFRLHGPSPHRADDNQMTALMYAAAGGHTEIVG